MATDITRRIPTDTRYIRAEVAVVPPQQAVTFRASRISWDFDMDMYPAKRQKHDYDFHLAHPDMLDVAKIQEELSMEKPLAILEWDGKVHYIVAEQVWWKSDALYEHGWTHDATEAISNMFDWHGDHNKTGEIVAWVKAVVNAPWPNKPEDPTCKVTIVEV